MFNQRMYEIKSNVVLYFGILYYIWLINNINMFLDYYSLLNFKKNHI